LAFLERLTVAGSVAAVQAAINITPSELLDFLHRHTPIKASFAVTRRTSALAVFDFDTCKAECELFQALQDDNMSLPAPQRKSMRWVDGADLLAKLMVLALTWKGQAGTQLHRALYAACGHDLAKAALASAAASSPPSRGYRPACPWLTAPSWRRTWRRCMCGKLRQPLMMGV
jgi:hypothetical protein